jgi:hypothetical protein
MESESVENPDCNAELLVDCCVASITVSIMPEDPDHFGALQHRGDLVRKLAVLETGFEAAEGLQIFVQHSGAPVHGPVRAG